MSNATCIAKFLGGIRNGDGWLVRCPAHKDSTPSLSLKDGPNGLVAHCFAGCDWRAVKGALAGMGLLRTTAALRGAFASLPEMKSAPSHEDLQKRERVKALWAEAMSVAGTLADLYLRCRGIICPLPATLRFHSRLRYSEGCFFPAMIAAVTRWPDKSVVAIHRTYIDPTGKGKAPVEPAKKLLGRAAGGAVRLAGVEETVCITEGIETGLSILQATGLPVWAALSTSGMTGLILPGPPLAARVVICADHDDAGFAAAEKAARRFIQEGRRVFIAAPPGKGQDFNDFLNKGVERHAA